MTERQMEIVGKLVVAGMLCGLAGACVYLTRDSSSLIWALGGLVVLWWS